MTNFLEEVEHYIMPARITNMEEIAQAVKGAFPVEQAPQAHLVADQLTLNTGPTGPGPSQLLQLDPNRISAILGFNVAQPASVTASGTTGVAPAQNSTVASISAAALQAVAPAGSTFAVQWTADLEGTAAAGDANNMFLSSPLGTLRQQGEYPAVVGQYNQQGLPDFVPGVAGLNVQVGGVGAGSAAAIYGAQITATPIGVGFVLICHSQASAQKAYAGALNEGFLMPVLANSDNLIRLTSSAPVWAVPVGNAIVTASVLSERRGA